MTLPHLTERVLAAPGDIRRESDEEAADRLPRIADGAVFDLVYYNRVALVWGGRPRR